MPCNSVQCCVLLPAQFVQELAHCMTEHHLVLHLLMVMPPAAERSSFALQVLEAVEERFGQVDAAVQQADTGEWEQRNEQRRLAAASQSTTPAKGAAAAAQPPLAAASRLLKQSAAEGVMQRPAQPLYDSPPSEIIELD